MTYILSYDIFLYLKKNFTTTRGTQLLPRLVVNGTERTDQQGTKNHAFQFYKDCFGKEGIICGSLIIRFGMNLRC
jgi:hypothetical protein